MTEKTVPSDIPDSNIVLSRISDEINNLSNTRATILSERLGWPSIIVLIAALALNIYGLVTYMTTYMAVWISSSLYFYLFYPMLPIFLFPLRYLKKKNIKPKAEKNKESPLKWAKNIQIFKNKRVGFRLFMRFFILSLLPLTVGMICIYLVSIIFSIYLGNTGVIPDDTSNLIFVQCGGIILFYVEIFFFRRQLFNFTQYVMKQRAQERKKIILLGILGFILLIIGTVVVFLLLIAILLPGYTLTSYINVSEFIRVRSNIWVILILITQVIIMQFLQNVLSIRISRNMCDDFINRLSKARDYLKSENKKAVYEEGSENSQNKWNNLKEPLKLLKEIELYSFNRRQMFGLFPTYSIGINLPSLFSIRTLGELKDIFFNEE